MEAGNTTATRLRRRIAYRLQELCFGGVSEQDQEKLKRIADVDPLSNLCQPEQKAKPKIQGIRYFREWKGQKYVAVSTGDGTFEYDGRVFKSLSAIAREITGTRWNGKIFWGVK